jgi:hypothetical protein
MALIGFSTVLNESKKNSFHYSGNIFWRLNAYPPSTPVSLLSRQVHSPNISASDQIKAPGSLLP